RPLSITAPLSPSAFPTLPPPCSALFPYTTLFRSLARLGLAERRVPRALLELAVHVLHEERHPARTRLHEPDAEPLELLEEHMDGDRKSTRLNSSHQIISYAVFCLKKKQRSPRPSQ